VQPSANTVGVKLIPSVPGDLGSAIWYALDTVLAVNKWSGGKLTINQILEVITVGKCIVDFAGLAGTDIENPLETAGYLKDPLGTVFNCFEEQLDETLGPGLLSAPLIAGLSWLLTGIQTALNGFGAAADTALNPDGFQILIRQPNTLLKDKPNLHLRRSLPGETACGTATLAEIPPQTLFVTGVSCSAHPCS
jgi:hypothetical protein